MSRVEYEAMLSGGKGGFYEEFSYARSYCFSGAPTQDFFFYRVDKSSSLLVSLVPFFFAEKIPVSGRAGILDRHDDAWTVLG